MVKVIRTDIDAGQRYRIIQTEKGYLVTERRRDNLGLLFSAEWLHRTVEAANACLDTVMTFNATWRAMQAGLPTQGLERAFREADTHYQQLCEKLTDEPLVGQDVRALRSSVDDVA